MKTYFTNSNQKLIVFYFFLFINANIFCNINLEQIILLNPPQNLYNKSFIEVKDKYIYIMCDYDNKKDKPYFWSGGVLAKYDTSGYQVFYKEFNADTLRLAPKALKIDNDNNIYVYSDISLYMYKDLFYTGQILDVRKFSPDGIQLTNYFDTTDKLNTLMSLFNVGFNKNSNPVVINTIKPELECISMINNYDIEGKLLSSFSFDSTYHFFDSIHKHSSEKFVVEGFTRGLNDFYYCYGNRQSLYSDIEDTLSAYVLAIDTNNKKVWRHIFYSGIITACNSLKDTGVVIVGIDTNSYICRFNSQGEILWKKFFGGDSLYIYPLKIIETSQGDFFVIGTARNKLGQKDKDTYIAKLNKDGELLWEEKKGLSIYEAYDCILEFAPNRFYLVEHSDASRIVYLFEDNITSVIDDSPNKNNTEFELFPNPVENTLYFNSSDYLGLIEIYSIYGTKLLESEWQERIDVSAFSAGMYFVRIGNKVRKFIKI